MAQNTNERDIRRKADGSVWDYTETHNNRFGNTNNKRPKRLTTTHPTK